MRSRAATAGTLSDLCWTAEQLYDDLKRAELYVEAACVWDALVSLRVKVRESKGEE